MIEKYDLELSDADYKAIRDAAMQQGVPIGHFIRHATREASCTTGTLQRDKIIRANLCQFLAKAA